LAKKGSDNSDKIIAQQAKENAALKAKLSAKEARASHDMEDQVDWSSAIAANQQKYNEGLDYSKRAQKDIRDISTEISEIIEYTHVNKTKLTKEERKEAGLLVKSLKLRQDQAKLVNKQAINQQSIAKIEKKILGEKKQLVEAQKKLNDLTDKYSGSVSKSLDFLDDIDDTIKDIPIVGDFLSKAIGLDHIKEELTEKFTGYLTNALNPAAAKQKEASEAAIAGYDAQVESLNLVTDAAGNITGVMEGIPEAADEAASGIGNITDGTKTAADGAKDIGHGLEGASGKAKGLLASFGPLLVIALAIAAAVKLFEGALELDKEVTEMARGLGTSREEAEHVHHELLDIGRTTKVVGASAEALGESYMELAKSMGVSQLANKEMAETQVYLKKQIGMSADEASSFQQMSMAGGKTAEQNLAVIQAGVEGMTGGLMNYKEVAKDIGNSSKAVQASYKGNIAALTKAVVTAKKFGMTLDQTKKSADSILDVESSLEAEMKANVLTGKNMNLNAARELALKGDTAGAMEEMMNQAGGYDDLMKMAPYQQKAVAEAMGMTVDEMIKGAEHQKNLNDMATDLGITLDENGKMSEEDMKKAMNSTSEEAKKLALQQQQNTAAEKMNALTDKLSIIWSGIASILLPIVDVIGTMAGLIGDGIGASLEYIKQLWTDIAPYVEGIATTVAIMLLPSLYSAASALIGMAVTALPAILSSVIAWGVAQWTAAAAAAAAAVAAIASASALTLGIGAIAIAGGIAVAAAAMSSESDKAEQVEDAEIDPEGGLVVKGKKGSFQLHKNDSIVAGTDLDASSTEESKPAESNSGSILGDIASTLMNPIGAIVDAVGGKGGGSDAEMVSLLKQILTKIDQPVNINIGGRVIQEIDRVATMNKTYNTKGDNTYGAT
jgi:O6-methylguanine-DNA--protein-cysteine methyltransferase